MSEHMGKNGDRGHQRVFKQNYRWLEGPSAGHWNAMCGPQQDPQDMLERFHGAPVRAVVYELADGRRIEVRDAE